MLTEQLEELLSIVDRGSPIDAVACHRSTSRIPLRSVLLSGLAEDIRFGKRFLRYAETEEGRIAAHFKDGSVAEASVLVAADGVNSAVRKQFLPHAEPIHTGVIGVAGCSSGFGLGSFQGDMATVMARLSFLPNLRCCTLLLESRQMGSI